ncbi:MAG: alpha-L-fucosidase [Clostridiales bacterium]|nr:alpha-L-fucosidase [Clostridiales bacterium]
MDRLDLYNSAVPNARQKIVQDMRFYAFVHFSINTFTNKEWGNGKENLKRFNPKELDTEQWCRAVKAAEMKGIILTAKHHDGFCLWQTKTTEHSIKNTPYKNGKGDIVAELAAACKKYGLKLGIYLSPWDRNSPCYGTDGYMDFYIGQLTELMTGYGDIFMLWLDGACGAHLDGKQAQVYDFERIYKTALKYQPNIALSNCAPDIRWVGNESGKARKSEWNVVPKFDSAAQNIADAQKDGDAEKFKKRCTDVFLDDMGSREFLSGYKEFVWYPAEVDVSIRKGWFYHKLQDFTVRSVDNLMKIYYNSVGGNSLLLLNIPPDKKGLFCAKDVKRLEEIGQWIRKERELKISGIMYGYDGETKEGFGVQNIADGKTFSPSSAERESYDIVLKFDKSAIDRVRLSENTDYSQRIESFELLTDLDGELKSLYIGTVVGFCKIAVFERTETDNLILRIKQSRKEPYINRIEVCKVGGYVPKKGRQVL